MKNNFRIFSLILTLTFIGLIFIAAASPMEASSTLQDQYFFIKKQLLWTIIGIFSFFLASRMNINLCKHISFPIFIISIILLFFTLIPKFSHQALGAKRWLNLGLIGIQPSEILKLSCILFFPSLFSNEKKRNIKNLLIYLALPFLLIVIEPNLSTAVLVVAIVTSIYYLSGGKIIPLFLFYLFITTLSFILIISSPYRLNRFKTLINQNDSSTANYHHNQIILALVSGGLFGKGFANSDQKYRFLPKLSTDSILAIIGEETGFFGISILISIYLYLIISLFKLSQLIVLPYESLLISAVACWIAYQTLINISAQLALIPLTGVPLPFVSYGGSSLVSLFFTSGLVYNIEKKYAKTEKGRDSYHRYSSHSRHRTNRTA